MCLFTEMSVEGIASLSPQPTTKHMLLGPWLLLANSEDGLNAEGIRGGITMYHVHLICLCNDEGFPRLVVYIFMYIL